MLKLYVAAKNKLASVKNFFAKKEEGATLVEYGLLVALIACACIAAITLLGTDLAAMFNGIAGKVSAATPAS
jgi:pilus assembly protein Flp/PilA